MRLWMQFFACLDTIIRCDIFPKKTWNAMRFFDAMRLPSMKIMMIVYVQMAWTLGKRKAHTKFLIIVGDSLKHGFKSLEN